MEVLTEMNMFERWTTSDSMMKHQRAWVLWEVEEEGHQEEECLGVSEKDLRLD